MDMKSIIKKSILSPVTQNLKAADQVEKKLILAIGLKEFRSGDKMTETELAKMLNVSRVPVREAMQRLLTFGVLQTGEGRGMRVSDYGGSRVKDLMEIRLAVERIMFDCVLKQTNSKEMLLEDLQKIVCRMAGVASDVNAIELSSIDLEFHQTIAHYSNHSFVEKVWDGLAPHLMIVFCGDWNVYSKRIAEVQDHQDLIEFIKNGNLNDIDDVLKQHYPEVQ
ncbi:MAG: GntR family transcriptional regulator [Planktomarina sp.]|nr:GntR family transcriptional regulator [Planktomarina sp.]